MKHDPIYENIYSLAPYVNHRNEASDELWEKLRGFNGRPTLIQRDYDTVGAFVKEIDFAGANKDNVSAEVVSPTQLDITVKSSKSHDNQDMVVSISYPEEPAFDLAKIKVEHGVITVTVPKYVQKKIVVPVE